MGNGISFDSGTAISLVFLGVEFKYLLIFDIQYTLKSRNGTVLGCQAKNERKQ